MARAKTTTKKIEKPKKEVLEKKPVVKKELEEEKLEVPIEAEKSERYYEAEGRRKTSVARVRLWTKGEKQFLVNQKPLEKYFPTSDLQKTVLSPFDKMKCLDKFGVSVVVKGGGLSGQAEAIRHGAARVLVLFNADFRKRLKKAGFLTRDPRMRERKKFGLKRARKAPQWAKR